MTLAKAKEQDGMMLAKVKEQDGMMLAKVKEQDGKMLANVKAPCKYPYISGFAATCATDKCGILFLLQPSMKHQRCRCLGGMQLFHIHSNKLQLLYLSVQQSQCSIIVMQSEANQC